MTKPGPPLVSQAFPYPLPPGCTGSSAGEGPSLSPGSLSLPCTPSHPHLDPKEPEDRSAARTLPRRRRCQRALRCSQGGGWKFEALLGEELDLRRVTWRLPPEVIPRLSASSGRSSDATELPRGPPDDGAGGAVGEGGSWAHGAAPGAPGGDRRSPTPHPPRLTLLASWGPA